MIHLKNFIFFLLVASINFLFAQGSSESTKNSSLKITTEDYYKSGGKKSEGKILKIDLWIYYHENGKKSQVARYINGKKHGVWEVYDENGDLVVEQEWIEGIAIEDTTRLDNIFQDIKIDGYEVKPIIVDPNSD